MENYLKFLEVEEKNFWNVKCSIASEYAIKMGYPEQNFEFMKKLPATVVSLLCKAAGYDIQISPIKIVKIKVVNGKYSIRDAIDQIGPNKEGYTIEIIDVPKNVSDYEVLQLFKKTLIMEDGYIFDFHRLGEGKVIE